MLDPLVQRLLNFGSDRKIGIRHPHWQDIPVTVLLPLGAITIAAINFSIEIKNSAHLGPLLLVFATIIGEAFPASKRFW
jgi:hypothetical protein